MAYKISKSPDAMLYGLVEANNLRQVQAVASFFHADKTQVASGTYDTPAVANDVVAVANASTEATGVALANAIKTAYNRHAVDDYAHNTAVSAVVATATATNEATAITLANALKAAYNTHLTEANVHFTNDSTNAVAADDATNAATLYTLLNEMKGDFNAHVISAPAGAMIRLVSV